MKPSQDDLAVVGAFNPGAALTGDGVVLLVRIAEVPAEKRAGWIALPRWEPGAERATIDWVREDDIVREDTRSVRFKRGGIVRLTFVSHLAIARSRDGRTIDAIESRRFLPAGPLEEFGVEDPRITRIGETFHIAYVAVSRHGPATALATTRDFRVFTRHGVILPPDNKDVVLFPEKIDGKFFAIHRPSISASLTRPEMWMATSADALSWGGHRFFRGGESDWETGRIGAGAPPIRTEAGWLELYHGNDRKHDESRVGRYGGGLLLLDEHEPWKVRGAAGPVFVPEADFELRGFVPEVVFPTGIVEQGETALVYYGAVDAVTGVTEFRKKDLLAAVR
ncbi:MAG TPA: hypothetical protein VG710_02390 [Opitutus sp.]|nr:hypothetical protein [Opitutus sp.]